ncbi:MAG: hypothetical protein GY858_05550 [Candidatus Omnitrophica bacterium]|nr:hypothetical protein [Candidatus Omnitrophota bacterium]
MSALYDLFQRAKQGVKDLPANIELVGQEVGKLLQKTPDTTVKLQPTTPSLSKVPPLLKPFSVNERMGGKVLEFLTSVPSDMLRSYGETLEAISSKKGRTELSMSAGRIAKNPISTKTLNEPALWAVLDVSDFIPGLGFVGLGTKNVLKGGAKEVAGKVVKTATTKTLRKPLKESAEQLSLKGLKTFRETATERVEKILKAIPEPTAETLRKRIKTGSYTNIRTLDNPLITGKPITKKTDLIKTKALMPTMRKDAQAFEESMKRMAGRDVTKKVHLLDYFRTPDRVLAKIGLKKEGQMLRKGYEKYLLQLDKEIETIRKWHSQAPDKESSRRIFQYLDGQGVDLVENELKVAKEIKTYFKDWANRLGLPADKRVTDYITHLFDEELLQKEFDPEISKMITDKVPASVYNPFTKKRLGTKGYKEDVWLSLQAYVKRSTRAVNMDPALKALKTASKDLDIASYDYVQKLGARINLRPTKTDELLDNLIKNSPVGYKYTSRPVHILSKKFREMVYRSTLGLNVGSATRNLTQVVNTYAKLGEKYTFIGYKDLIARWSKGEMGELYSTGILKDDIWEDKTIGVVKKGIQKIDPYLWGLFEMAEKINRGSAYFGGKKKALAKGMSEEKAVEYAKKIVRDTQFTFGSVDTPLALSSDIAKTLLQFKSFSIKQAEFVSEMVKSKDFAGLVRYISSTLVLYGTIGKLFGMEATDMIPFYDTFTQKGRFQSPATDVATSVVKNLSSDERTRAEGQSGLGKSAWLTVPAGSQIKKTLGGVGALSRGYSKTPSGNVRFPTKKTTGSAIRNLLFGQYQTPEARRYFDENLRPLSASQTKKFKRLKGTAQQRFYEMVLKNRK